MKFLSLVLISIFLIQFSNSDHAEARRRHRSRSREPVIVHRLLNLKGTALIDGKVAPEFAGIKEGNLIETKEDSYLIARMVGLGMFRLGENSRVKLQRFLNRDKLKMEALKGDVLVFIKRPGEHLITAGDQVITINNDAIVRIKVNDNHEAQVCACKGEFKSSARNSATESSTAAVTSSPNTAAPTPSPVAAQTPAAKPREMEKIPPQVCCKGIDLEVMESLYQLP